MARFVILFRGINVGGHNKLPMKPLVTLLENNGLSNVAYYIQSGNLLLDSNDDPTLKIKALVTEFFNITPDIITLPESQFLSIKTNNPFDKYDGKLVHFYICKHSPTLNTEKINQYQTLNEKLSLIENTLYLYAPDGIGRSKLVKNIEKCLGTSATGRNLNTINKIFSMLK